MDTAGFSTQRCDGIYIRRMETCARSMQQIFAFLRWFWNNNNNNFSTTFKSYLVTASLEENTVYCLKLRSIGGNLRIWPQNWRSLRSNNKVLVFIMHRKPHFFGLVCHRRFFPRWHFRLFLIWILKYLIFRPHEMFNVFVCRTASYWNI